VTRLPQDWDVPVYALYGTYHPDFDQANILYEPLEYEGGLPAVVDPTDPDTFAELLQRDDGFFGSYYFPRDLTFRLYYADGSIRHALYVHDSVSRSHDVDSGVWRGDLLYFALAVPRDGVLTRIELYHRPFVVRGSSDTTEGNIANPSFGITAQNFMDSAELIVARDL
jgi:hypothetical protein